MFGLGDVRLEFDATSPLLPVVIGETGRVRIFFAQKSRGTRHRERRGRGANLGPYPKVRLVEISPMATFIAPP